MTRLLFASFLLMLAGCSTREASLEYSQEPLTKMKKCRIENNIAVTASGSFEASLSITNVIEDNTKKKDFITVEMILEYSKKNHDFEDYLTLEVKGEKKNYLLKAISSHNSIRESVSDATIRGVIYIPGNVTSKTYTQYFINIPIEHFKDIINEEYINIDLFKNYSMKKQELFGSLILKKKNIQILKDFYHKCWLTTPKRTHADA